MAKDQRLYSQTTGCAYLQGLHERIPSDAVPISDDRYILVIANPPAGKQRAHDPQGLPILVDAPEPTDEQLADTERVWRDQQVSASEWLTVRHREESDAGVETTLSADRYTELLSYRQALRDWPQSQDFPEKLHRPSAPSWLSL